MRLSLLVVLLLGYAPFAQATEPKSATLYVENIQCVVCAATVKKALNGVPGVTKVVVDVDKKEVIVQFDSAKTNAADLAAATANRGFPATIRKVEP